MTRSRPRPHLGFWGRLGNRRCRLRRLTGGRWNGWHGRRWRSERSDLRREKLIQLIERIRRRRGPRTRARKLPIEVFHPSPQIVDDTLVVEFVREHSRRDEHDEFGAVVLDVLLAKESSEYRYSVQQWDTTRGVPLAGNDEPAHD